MRGDENLGEAPERYGTGVSAAVTALGQLVAREVTAGALRVRPLLEEQSFSGKQDVCISLRAEGNWDGSILILFGDDHARLLLEMLLGVKPESSRLSEMELSALKEVGNIMASACLNELGRSMKMHLLPSVPELLFGDVVPQAAASHPGGTGKLAIETEFSIGERCKGRLVLISPQESLG